MVWIRAKRTFIPVNKMYPTYKTRWIDKETGLRKNFDGTLEKPQFMKTKRGRLTKTQKKVVAKIMYDAGWGSKRLSQWFGVHQSTITNWKDVPTPEALKLFEESFKAAMMDYDMSATFGIKSRIMNLVPIETNIDKLVKAGEFFQGKDNKKSSSNNTQVNVYGDMLKKYGQGTEIPVTIITQEKK